jgi:hypothetical protein
MFGIPTLLQKVLIFVKIFRKNVNENENFRENVWNNNILAKISGFRENGNFREAKFR